MRIVYHWLCGAYVNSLCEEFDQVYAELCAQYGYPAVAQVLYDNDWN